MLSSGNLFFVRHTLRSYAANHPSEPALGNIPAICEEVLQAANGLLDLNPQQVRLNGHSCQRKRLQPPILSSQLH